MFIIHKSFSKDIGLMKLALEYEQLLSMKNI